jgi:predicted AAA+ superfamily ATPase
LNEVHLLIEQKHTHFVLTGSNARKLRHGGVNLLGGRARSKQLHPFVAAELGDAFLLPRALEFGSLPSIWFSSSPAEDLASYTQNYLQQEIVAEGASRNLPAFARFLQIAALGSGQILNFTQISSDAQVPRTTVHEYYGILKDTLLGCELPALKKAATRKPVSTSKFYLFDIGVVRSLQKRKGLACKTPEYGDALEHWIFHELNTWCSINFGHELSYWRTSSGFEVDFVLDESIAIEVKAKENVAKDDLKGLVAIAEDMPLKKRILVCLEPRPRIVNGIEIMHALDFCQKLWRGQI